MNVATGLGLYFAVTAVLSMVAVVSNGVAGALYWLAAGVALVGMAIVTAIYDTRKDRNGGDGK